MTGLKLPKPPKQRRDALLIDTRDLMVVTDRRGRSWVTDRFTLVRADLFKSPPTKDSGLFADRKRDVDMHDRARGEKKSRSLLRSIRCDDTVAVKHDRALSDAVGDTAVAWFKIGHRALYISASAAVCAGYAAAHLQPRFHQETGAITWWAQVNRGRHSLMALCMPRVATPAPRGGTA